MSMTQKDYLDAAGVPCPMCGAENVESTEPVQVDGGHAWQTIYCHECEGEYHDLWKLTGYDIVVAPKVVRKSHVL